MLRILVTLSLLAHLLFFPSNPSLCYAGLQRSDWDKSYEKAGEMLDAGDEEGAEAAIKQSLKAATDSKIHQILSLELLAELLEKQKKYSEEEAAVKEMLEKMRSVIFPINIVSLTYLKAADLNFTLGRFSTAREYYAQSIPLLKAAFGKNSYEVALALNNLAFTEVEDRNFNRAAEHFLEVLNLLEKKAGKRSELYGRVSANLADVYERLEDWNSARQWYQKAMDAFIHACGAKDPVVLELERYLTKFRSAESGGVLK